MSEEEKNKKEKGEISRREFLKDAGLVVGGAAIGSTVLLAACAPEAETETVTTTVTETVSKFVCPYDSMEFNTLAALQAHVNAVHPAEPAIEGLSKLVVNGDEYYVKVKNNWSLAYVIREKLGLIGTKRGCDMGQCGACTLIMDGRPVMSCMVLAVEAVGKAIETIEGLTKDGELLPIQQAFIDHDAMQCGFCTPGLIMSAKALLDVNPDPTADEVREALAGNLCRCGSYQNILAAVLEAAK